MTALPAGDETLIAAVIPPPAPEPEPELPPELDPESLIGSPASDVEQRLGLPVLRRLEGTTEVWQYRMESCIIDFVLPEGTTVLALNSRHRQHGQSYDALSCRRDLAMKAGLLKFSFMAIAALINDRASPAFRLAGDAGIAAMQDKPVMRTLAVNLRHALFEQFFNSQRR